MSSRIAKATKKTLSQKNNMYIFLEKNIDISIQYELEGQASIAHNASSGFISFGCCGIFVHCVEISTMIGLIKS